MKALFKELPPFERARTDYLDDNGFRSLQNLLLANPQAGAVIEGTGGLRKLRYSDSRRGKGKRRHPRDLLLVAIWSAVLAFYNFRQRRSHRFVISGKESPKAAFVT